MYMYTLQPICSDSQAIFYVCVNTDLNFKRYRHQVSLGISYFNSLVPHLCTVTNLRLLRSVLNIPPSYLTHRLDIIMCD